ncbi:hypothetical protein R83H12_00833 [Fibrobacteria bacterium R8-3-H12]
MSYALGEFTDASGVLTAKPTLSSTTLTYTGAGKENGKATLKVTVSSQNYADFTATIDFNATAKLEVAISGLTKEDYVYDGTPKLGVTGTATSGAYIGTLIYEYSGMDIENFTKTQPTHAGEYVLRVSVPESAAYTGRERYEFVIAKANPPTPTGLTATAGQTLAKITLPSGWAWVTPTALVDTVAGATQTHKANYTPDASDAVNYNALTDVDVSVEVVTPTPIFSNRANPAMGQIGVQTIAQAILLSNLPANAKVEVYNLQGKRIYSTTSHSLATSLTIEVQAKGMYIVKAGNQTMRVTVR